MKKTIFYILMCLALGMAACFDDDSTLGKDFIPDIEIGELKDTAMVSYSGHVLEVTPEVNTRYTEDQLAYAWYIYNSAGTTTTGEAADGYQKEKIGDGKTLRYEVNLPSGAYTLVFEATAVEYGYVRTASMQMSVSTNFSKGFYILKSTEDGKTDLDLATKEGLSEDLMTNMLGAPLEGAPLNMSVVYGQCYIDDATQEMAYDKVLNLFTEKDYRGFRTEDMAEVHNRQTIFYEPAQDDEVLYGMEQGMMSTFLFTNKGYYGGTPGGKDWFGGVTVTTGQHGFPVGSGGSRFIQQLEGGYDGVAYWNEVQRTLCLADYNAVGTTEIEYELPGNMSPETVNCMACGLNYVGGSETVWFLLKDASAKRCLLLLSGSRVKKVVLLDASLHIAQADIVAGNALSATIIYVVHDDKLWAYSWDGNNEYEIPLPGVEGKLDYVSNQFLNVGLFGTRTENFDALIVGTTQAEKYNLYIFDNMVGGAPQKAVKPYQGVGRVKSVRYVPSIQVSLDDFSMAADFGPIAPWTD